MDPEKVNQLYIALTDGLLEHPEIEGLQGTSVSEMIEKLQATSLY